VDSVHSHLAWTRSIEEKLGVRIPFPIVADLDTRVARACGMLRPNTSGTAAVRAVFVIDPEQTVRAVLYYPMNTGRMISEILRLVDALQTSDLVEQVQGIITVGEFYEHAAGGQIIYT